MFEIGFAELVLIAIIGLLVIGPQRLPVVARTLGRWVGRARSVVASVKADFDREMKADELKRILEEQARLPDLKGIIDDTQRDLDRAAAEVKDASASVARAGEELKATANEPAIPPPSTPGGDEPKK